MNLDKLRATRHGVFPALVEYPDRRCFGCGTLEPTFLSGLPVLSLVSLPRVHGDCGAYVSLCPDCVAQLSDDTAHGLRERAAAVMARDGISQVPSTDLDEVGALVCGAFPDIAAEYSDTEIRQRLLTARGN